MSKKIVLFVFLCLISMLLISGCSGDTAGGDELKAGYYKRMVMQPNGIFIGIDKIDDKKATSSGLAYKVKMNEQRKLSQITAMYNGKPMDTE